MALSPEWAAPWGRRVPGCAVTAAGERVAVALGPRQTPVLVDGKDRRRVDVVPTGPDWRIEQDEQWPGILA